MSPRARTPKPRAADKPAGKPRPRPRARDGEGKRDVTRRHLLDTALALFQRRGVEATTMRDIARAAGLSLGAAYYHFPSKDALLFAYYADTQAALDALAARTTGTPRERLAALLHARLDVLAPHRAMLASIVGRVVNPGDPVSALSSESRAIRAAAIAHFDEALAPLALPAEVRGVAGQALWLLAMALLLVFVNDSSPGQRKTHDLVDDTVELVLPLLPLLATPIGRALAQRIASMLDRAGLTA